MNPLNFLVFLVVLSLMMVLHELGHFITARLSGITVQEFGIGLPPRVWGMQRGDVTYSVNAIPFGAFVKMLGEEDPSAPGSFASKSRGIRAIVLAAGSGMNFLLAVAAFTVMYLVGVPTPTGEGPARLVNIAPDSPAAAAGLQPGDQVVSFAGEPISGAQQFRDLTQAHLGQPTEITIRRGEDTITTTVAPRSTPPEGQGALGVVLGANMRIEQSGPVSAVVQGFRTTFRVIGGTLAVPKMLIEGAIKPADARPIGLPGMAQLTSQAVDVVVDRGFWFPLFQLTGVFSAGLSVANMLPIPALDGGRLFFVVLEWIRGRRIPPEREAAYHFVGIVVLLTLMVLISVNDIRSPMPTLDWGLR